MVRFALLANLVAQHLQSPWVSSRRVHFFIAYRKAKEII
jgi:hypothetical protein